MSITKIRKGLPAGCGLFFGIVFIAVLVIGLIPNLPGNRGSGEPNEIAVGAVAFKVNGQPVYEGPLKVLIQQGESNILQQKRSSGQQPELTPYDYLDVRVRAFKQASEAAAVAKVAESQGIKVSTEDIAPFMASLAEEQIASIQQNVQMMSGLRTVQIDTLKKQLADLKAAKKEGSPEYKKIEEGLKNLESATEEQMFAQYSQGMTKEQIREMYKEQTDSILAQPALAVSALGDVGRGKLIEKLKSEVDVSEAAVKASYQKFTFDRIDILSAQTPDPKAKATEVFKKIQGGMDFKSAIAQFSDAKPIPSSPESLQLLDLQSSGLGDLSKVKVGSISEPIETESGFIIAKVIKVEPNLPADYAKQIPARAQQMRSQLANYRSNVLLTEATKTAKYEFEDTGWKLLDQYDDMRNGDQFKLLSGASNRDKRLKAWLDLVSECENAPEADDQLRVLVRFAAFAQVDAEMPPGPEKEKLAAQRLQIYSDTAQYVEASNFRFELINLQLEAKKGDEALDRLLEIAMTAQDPTPSNRQTISRIEALLPKAANLATKDSPLIQQIQDEIKRWREAEAEQKKQETEQKRIEEEAKKAEAAEKAKSAAPKTPGN